VTWLTSVRLDQYPHPDRGHSKQQVRAYIAKIKEQRMKLQLDRMEELPDEEVSEGDSSYDKDLEDGSESQGAEDSLTLEEYQKIFETLKVGFVLVDSRRMDLLLQEARVKAPVTVPQSALVESTSINCGLYSNFRPDLDHRTLGEYCLDSELKPQSCNKPAAPN
jgi:hypothetical protein